MSDFEKELEAFDKEINDLASSETERREIARDSEKQKSIKDILREQKAYNGVVQSSSIASTSTIVGKNDSVTYVAPKLNPSHHMFIEKKSEVTKEKSPDPVVYEKPAVPLQIRTKKLRQVGGKYWEDSTLDEWPENDFRIFVGNLDKETTDTNLETLFQKYRSFNMARVVKKNKKLTEESNKSAFNIRREVCKGYGFVSFSDPKDMLRALKEMNGKYCQNRPMQLKRGKWADREVENVRKKQKKDKRFKKFLH